MSGQLIFFILASLSVITALLVVFSKNPIHSVLWLVACFFTIAGHFVVLHAPFLAIIHIIVYAGAIMVLMLFTVMLLNLNKETEPHKTVFMKLAAIISAGLLFVTLLAAMRSSFPPEFVLPTYTDAGTAQSVGKKLFNDYLLPFEISSVLFISAMIGAVLLGKKETN